MMMFDDALAATIAHARRHTVGDLLRRTASRVPDKTAIVYRDLRQSYAELDATVNRTANAFAERGVVKGDRVALLSHNNHGYIVTCLALARLGAITVPVNFMLGAAEVAFILEHAGASGVVVEDAMVTVAEKAIKTAQVDTPKVRGVIGGAAGMSDGWESFTAWTEHPDTSAPDVPIDDDDVLQLMYTSGTESRPKGTMMTSRSLIAQYVSCIVDGRYSTDDVEIHALPLFHVAAQHCFLMPSLYVGATNILLEAPDASTILATVEQSG